MNWKLKRTLDMGFEEEDNAEDAKPQSFKELASIGDYDELVKFIDMSEAQEFEINDDFDTRDIPELNDHIIGSPSLVPTTKPGKIRKKPKQVKGPRSAVFISQLYGSGKVGYEIPRIKASAREKVQFSHKRVFGNKNAEAEA
jgi:hypothetical protein